MGGLEPIGIVASGMKIDLVVVARIVRPIRPIEPVAGSAIDQNRGAVVGRIAGRFKPQRCNKGVLQIRGTPTRAILSTHRPGPV